MPQNLIRCSVCRQRPEAKLAQVTWAWVNVEQLRTAYRQRLCVQCFAVRVLAYEKPLAPDEPLTCVACGIDVEDAPEIVYCTTFAPGLGKLQYAFPFCEPHAQTMREMCKEGAILLQEREPMLGGQDLAPQREHASLAAWRALGLEPND